MPAKKKLTKKQIKDKAKAAAKRITRGKISKGVALGAVAIDRGLSYMANKNPEEITIGIPLDYTGMNFQTGEWDGERMARGVAPVLVDKAEKYLFRLAGVKSPPLKPKGFKDGLRMVTYEGAAAMNAHGGSTRQDKYRRWIHSHYGVDLNLTGLDAIDIMKPAMEKWLPYIAMNKVLQLVK